MEPLRSQSRLDIMLGSMFSGKSSALLRKLSQFEEMGLSALYINHDLDNRSGNAYSTHSPLLKDRPLEMTTLKTKNLESIEMSSLSPFDVIGIDEAQFFGEELVSFVKKLVENHNKYVIIVGLDGDYRREKFGYLLDLIPLADNVVKLHAYCKRCAENHKTLRNALFTHRTVAVNGILVGGSESYDPVCRGCYLELN